MRREAEVEPAAVRVRRGAVLMESVRPGSVSALDLVELDVADVERCPLGQTFGTYLRGCDALGFGTFGVYDQALEHGLQPALTLAASPGWSLTDADALNEAWREEVARWRR